MFRLFMGERRISGGTPPRALVKAFALDRAPDIEKFNPYQLRVPAGSGRESGEWTSGGSGDASEDVETDLKPTNASMDEGRSSAWTELMDRTRFILDPDSPEPQIVDVDAEIKPSDFPDVFATSKSSNMFVTAGDGTFGAIARSDTSTAVEGTIFSTGAVMIFNGSHVVTLAPSIDGYGLTVTMNRNHTITVVQSKQEAP